MKRRQFNKNLLMSTVAGIATPSMFVNCRSTKDSLLDNKSMFFKISLAQWSFNRALTSGKLNHLDFAEKAKSMGIHAIEYVNQFFADKAEDTSFLNEMNDRANSEGVKQLLIMIDNEGNLGNLNRAQRDKAVENHFKWVHAAKYLGCHSIRVNAAGIGTREDVAAAATESLARLAEYAVKEKMNVLVENHGGYSSDGTWLSNIIKNVNLENCGTLPDFGNFCIKSLNGKCVDMYDRYKGIEQLMPFAKAMSAKSNVFNEKGEEVNIDYLRIMKTVKKHGYKGYVGIEFEGSIAESEGVMATKRLLEKVGMELSSN